MKRRAYSRQLNQKLEICASESIFENGRKER
jgi:hypothetical protein